MTAKTGSDYYQRGLKLAEAGQYQEGWDCLCEHLRGAPQDVQALNDGGVILHCLGRTDEAIGLLMKARQLEAGNAQIVWNLVETYLGGGRATEAARLFDEMERMGTLGIDVLNRTATLLLDQGNKGQAIEVLLRSYRLWPQQEVLQPILDVIRVKRPKVAFFRRGAGEDGVLADICEFVRQRFPTEFYAGRDPKGIAQLMQWSDIAWFDGGGEMAIEACESAGPVGAEESVWEPGTADRQETTLPGRDAVRPKIIISVRRSDVQDRWAKAVPWENVDLLAQIGSCAVEEALLSQVPDLRRRTRLVVVPNGVNLRRYPLRRRDRGKHLACLGCLTMEANPGFLVQCMQKLHYLEAGYRLFFSGRFENSTLEQYVRHMVRTLDLTSVISFDPDPGDLNGWLSDKHFIVAAGIGENQVEALLAGMACGLKPVVHNFPGADKLLPPQYLFNIAEQFCEQVLSHDYQPAQYRRLVEERYPVEQQLKRVEVILAQLETEIELQAVAALGKETSIVSNETGVSVAADGVR
jgi:glycosyltransferase involved in cell wall biosynthesis